MTKKIINQILLLTICLLYGIGTKAQVKIGDNPTTIDARSVLELESTTKALYHNRLSSTQRDAQTGWKAGMSIYNTTDSCFQMYNGVIWECFSVDDADTTVYDCEVYMNANSYATSTIFTLEPDSITYVSAHDASLMNHDSCLYIGADGSVWTRYNVRKRTANRTEWYYRGTVTDAGASKGGYIWRPGRVSIGNKVAEPWAILELKSTNKGLLLPRVALSRTNAATPLGRHIQGMTVYNTASTSFGRYSVKPGRYYNDGTKWIPYISPAIDDIIDVSGLGEDLPSPNAFTGATFSPNTPTNGDYLYVNETDGTTWIWNGTAYESYQDPNPTTKTNWYKTGTTIDNAGSKVTGMWRKGSIRLAPNSTSGFAGPYSIAAGSNDTAKNYSISVGISNKAIGNYSATIGGSTNKALGLSSGIFAGLNNQISATSQYSAIAGGQNNYLNGAIRSFIGGGQADTVLGTAAGILAGINNNADGAYTFIAGGNSNKVTSTGYAGGIAGGTSNTLADGFYGFIAGGTSNYINNVSNSGSSIIAGDRDTISGSSANAVILGGNRNVADKATLGVISGNNNEIRSTTGLQGYANTILGGSLNKINAVQTNSRAHIIGSDYSYISAGTWSNAIFGGRTDSITGTGYYNAILAGYQNKIADGNQQVIMGGADNKILQGANSSIISGNNNKINTAQTGTQGIYNSTACEILGTDAGGYGQNIILGGNNSTINAGATQKANNLLFGRNGNIVGHGGNVMLCDFTAGTSTSVADNAFTGRFAGGYRLFSSGTTGVSLAASGTAWVAISDRRSKNSITDINYGLATLMKLRPTMYKYNGSDKLSLGFIAQEVQEVVPEVVEQTTMGENQDYLGVKYTELIPVLTKAIQEQQAIIEKLEKRITELEKK